MAPGTVITDRYLRDSRLRLRRAQDPSGAVIYKLTQKIQGPNATERLVTTAYLNEGEYQRLSTLDADVIEKVRHPFGPYGIDVFSGRLLGLVLAELEATPGERAMASAPPPGSVCEVTSDDRFSGGALVRLGADGLATLLLEFLAM